jgi:hypothetical protein
MCGFSGGKFRRCSQAAWIFTIDRRGGHLDFAVHEKLQVPPGHLPWLWVQDFLRLDPRFASTAGKEEEEFRALVDEAHARGIYVIIDSALHRADNLFQILFSNKSKPSTPEPVKIKDNTEVHEPEGGTNRGQVTAISVSLKPMEIQILSKLV